jgi:hypothetical protein
MGRSIGSRNSARPLQSLLIVLVVDMVVCFVSRVTGDPISLMAPVDATPKEIQAIILAVGLSDSIYFADCRLTVVSFADYRVPEALAVLRRAIGPGFDIWLVLESAEASQGQPSHDAAAFESFGPSATFYVWPAEQRASAAAVLGHGRSPACADGVAHEHRTRPGAELHPRWARDRPCTVHSVNARAPRAS